jgi:hypothetical protein
MPEASDTADGTPVMQCKAEECMTTGRKDYLVAAIVVILALSWGLTYSAFGHSPFDPVTDDPRLPRVLLIGDSISIGYTLPVRRLLEGKANVHRIPVNGAYSANGLAHIRNGWVTANGT